MSEGRPFTRIISNGSGRTEPLQALLDRLASHTLDPDFEAYGNFITRCIASRSAGYDHSVSPPRLLYVDTGPIYPEAPDAVRFWGNFLDVSAVFCVDTNDPATMGALTAAIRANQATPAYLSARDAILK